MFLEEVFGERAIVFLFLGYWREYVENILAVGGGGLGFLGIFDHEPAFFQISGVTKIDQLLGTVGVIEEIGEKVISLVVEFRLKVTILSIHLQ